MYELTLNKILLLDQFQIGVYRIYLYDNQLSPIEINRLLSADKLGLIYIGSSQENSIQYRLKCFLHSMDPNRRQNNHSGGLKIFNNSNLQDFLKDKKLMFDCVVREDAKDYERELLNKYKSEFWEVPPLNG